MTKEATAIMWHILDARIDNSKSLDEYFVLCTIRDCFGYAVADNLECLREFDYLPTAEEDGFLP